MKKLLVAAFGVAASMACASPALAQDNDGTCRASAARVTVPAVELTVEPVRANANGTPCTSQSASTVAPTTVGPLSADAVGAFTDGSGAAFASAAHATVVLGPLTVGVTAVEASATAPCGTAPVGTSRVVGLSINGETIVLPPDDEPVDIPLGPLGSVSLNKETVENGVLTRRAVEIVTPLGTVVLAEAIAKAATCPKDGGGTGVRGVPPVCPDGSTYDPERNVCIVRDSDGGNGSNNTGGGGGNGNGDVPAGRPFEGPSGGTVLTISDARAKYKSVCLKGAGPAFAIVGTKGNDNITGTNDRDRIILLAGTDKSEGGRGDDCIDGGKGRDTMSGALGNDKLVGGRGNDSLVGGSHNDRLFSGSGNDTINSGFGKDRIKAGGGRDRINIATAGPAVRRIACGKGRGDKIRVNRNEKRMAKKRKNGCEIVYVIR